MRSVVQLYPGPPSYRSLVTRRWSLVFANHERPKTNDRVGAVAQLGERLVCNQEATGSIPVSSTRIHAMTRSIATLSLILGGIMWLGSIPWLIYLAASREIPWSVPAICVPIYAFLLYAAWKTYWPRVRSAGAKQPDVGRQTRQP